MAYIYLVDQKNIIGLSHGGVMAQEAGKELNYLHLLPSSFRGT